MIDVRIYLIIIIIISIKIIICESSIVRRKVIVLDGNMDSIGVKILQDNNFEVCNNSYELQQIPDILPDYDVLVVRSATKINENLLRNCGNQQKSKLRLIGRAGVGLDNINLKLTKEMNINVINTPTANSRSVAEMVFAHIFTLSRSLHLSNQEMKLNPTSFTSIKKLYAKSNFELYGKKIGIIGAGVIGKEVARMAIGMGLEVLIHDYKGRDIEIGLNSVYSKLQDIKISLSSQPLSTVLSSSDIITLHTAGKTEIIGTKELSEMKKGTMLINCARGGVVNEQALLDAISNGYIKHIGLDVFLDEQPSEEDSTSYNLIKNPLISTSPHIGASTKEAQQRVAFELANGIVNFFK